MNIDEIRAEIPKALEGDAYKLMDWYNEHKKPYAAEICGCSVKGQRKDNVRILVDMAYEAGVKRGGEISMSALNDVELHENPVYQKGYEEGINKGLADGAAWASEVNQTALEFYDYKRGYDDAAKDPKAWYVLDKKGEPVHIGDIVKDKNGEYEIKALGIDIIFERYWHKAKSISKCEKVIPDTRDKIKEELAEAIWEGWDDYDIGNADNPGELAEQFISRIEALGRNS